MTRAFLTAFVVALVLLVAVGCQRAVAAECLTLARARQAWPSAYLAYRSTPEGRCWSAGLPSRFSMKSKMSPSVPLPPEAPAIIRSPIDIGHAAFPEPLRAIPVKTIPIKP